jgi:hypothetical protein
MEISTEGIDGIVTGIFHLKKDRIRTELFSLFVVETP